MSESPAEQDERLTRKHIKALGYVQELMKENKQLKKTVLEFEEQKLHCDELHAENAAAQEKIKLIQEQSLKRTDEINALLIKKHEAEIMKLVEEKLHAERHFEQQTHEMAKEIERIQKLNASLEEALQAKLKSQNNQREAVLKIDQCRGRVEELEKDNKTLMEANNNQLKEITTLQAEVAKKAELQERISQTLQKLKEQEIIGERLQGELTEANKALDNIQKNTVTSYKTSLITAQNEIGSLQNRLEKQQQEIEALKLRIRETLSELEQSELTRYKLAREAETLKEEIAELKRQLQGRVDKGNSVESLSFKDFVVIKRELSALREENEKLKEQLSGKGRHKSVLHRSSPVVIKN